MELSKRLQAVADLLDCHETVADIGCDHGFVSIYLIESKKAGKCLAMDVNKGPLERAKEHIMQKRLSTYIETRLSDGAKEIQFVKDEYGMDKLEVDAALIAGMGGRLMIQIIADSLEKFQSMEEFVLQPQSEIEEFRRFLRTTQFSIVEEKMILEEGKFYPMMRVRKVESESIKAQSAKRVFLEGDQDTQTRLEDKFGPLLLASKDETLKKYLQFQLHICKEILERLKDGSSEKIEIKRAEVLAEIEDIQLAMKQM